MGFGGVSPRNFFNFVVHFAQKYYAFLCILFIENTSFLCYYIDTPIGEYLYEVFLMTIMSKLRAARICRMCINWTDYDPSVVSNPVLDDDSRRHWQVLYAHTYYHVSELRGEWFVSRIEALVSSLPGDFPERDDVILY